MKFIKDALLGGIFISVGAVAYLKLKNPVIFSLGILAVTLTGTLLVTAFVPKVFYKNSIGGILKKVGLIPLMAVVNCVAAWFMGWLNFVDTADVAAAKLAQSPLQNFVSAIFCGGCIAVGVLLDKNEDGKHRLWVLMGFITLFVACGFEHVVADAFYFSGAINNAIHEGVTNGESYYNALYLNLNSIGQAFSRLIIILCGNAVGGGLVARAINN
ncbi:formate/nitrite transporter [Clostridia bacterium]|nr:formate/nitrite transporter [Clostridia bacterium]